MEDGFSNMPMNMNMGNMNFGYGFGANELGVDLCIDEPAKRLYSPNGGFNNQRTLQQQFSQFGLGQGQGQFSNNQELMKAYREQQIMAMQQMGNTQAAIMLAQEEHKPFRCPVIGCEKAYKNQNGLKYVFTIIFFEVTKTDPPTDTIKLTATKPNNFTKMATVPSPS